MSNAQQNIIDNQAFDIYKQEKLAKLFILIHTIFGFILFQGCLVNKKVLEVLGDKYKLKSKTEIPRPKSPECKLILLDPTTDGNDSEFELPTHRLQKPYRKRTRQGITEGSSPLLKSGTSASIVTLNQLGDHAEWDGSPIIPHLMTLPAAAAGSSPVRCTETDVPEVITDDSDEFMDLLYA